MNRTDAGSNVVIVLEPGRRVTLPGGGEFQVANPTDRAGRAEIRMREMVRKVELFGGASQSFAVTSTGMEVTGLNTGQVPLTIRY